jgi:CRISPR-associated protein Cas5t
VFRGQTSSYFPIEESNMATVELHFPFMGATLPSDHGYALYGAISRIMFWIVPVRRELLIDYVGMIGVQSEVPALLDSIRRGLRGEHDLPRYGLPFAGDNNLMIDRLDIIDRPPDKTIWYAAIQPDDPPRKGSYRLTVGIDRTDNSRTVSRLYAPLADGASQPPENAWTWSPTEPAL